MYKSHMRDLVIKHRDTTLVHVYGPYDNDNTARHRFKCYNVVAIDYCTIGKIRS